MFDIKFTKIEHYFITDFLKWFINQFGPVKLILIIGGIIYFFCIKALIYNIKNDNYERVLLIVILIIIILGGLIGFAIEYS